VKGLLESAVAKASSMGSLALVNRPDGPAMMEKLTTLAKTRARVNDESSTPEERVAFADSLERQLASMADSLGGLRELEERLAISATAHTGEPAPVKDTSKVRVNPRHKGHSQAGPSR
jgi:hypothetical protein